MLRYEQDKWERLRRWDKTAVLLLKAARPASSSRSLPGATCWGYRRRERQRERANSEVCRREKRIP
jgi:hypothetical protein